MVTRCWLTCALLAGCAFEGSQSVDGTALPGEDAASGLPDARVDAAVSPTDAAPGPDAAGADAGPGEDGWMVVDSIQVPSDGTAATSAVALEEGATYRLRVTGSVEVAAGFRGDADWYWDVDQPNIVYDTYLGTDIGVAIDDVEVDWGDANLAHVYVLEVEGAGEAIEAVFVDPNYYNNSGTLLLQILAPTP